MDAPTGYIEVKDGRRYDYKAVSARGNVIALKSRSNESRDAGLDFWTDAVEHEKVDVDGMSLAAREPIKSAKGLDGVLFQFETGEGQGQITYLVALYVTPSRILTVEAAGSSDAIAKDLDNIKAAMLTVR